MLDICRNITVADRKSQAGEFSSIAPKAGKLRAAACDAFVTEPPTAANTNLYELDNFIGTPRIGAGTEEALVRMGEESVANVITVLEGGQPARRVV